ncbi:MAG TPA: hypothetical protein VKV17_18460 [Bryobacteraceae bacterium]|nr:hypothetical protein [Bryobacteraceae bacterium]
MIPRASALLVSLVLAASADTLVLKNGKRIEGRWWATSATTVSFLVNDHLEYFSRSDVSEIVFGSPQDPPPASKPDRTAREDRKGSGPREP